MVAKGPSNAGLDRRSFLVRTGAALAAAGALGRFADLEEIAVAAAPADTPSWAEVRRQFRHDPRLVQLGGLYLASHPATVRAADRPPPARARRQPGRATCTSTGRPRSGRAARRRGVPRRRGADIALTDSTTMGLGLLYNGLELKAGDEVVTTTHDFYATHRALELKAARSGAPCGACGCTTVAARRRGRDRLGARAPSAPRHARGRDHLGALEHGREAARAADRRCARPTASWSASTGCTASAPRTGRSARSAATSSSPAATSGSSARAAPASSGASRRPGTR